MGCGGAVSVGIASSASEGYPEGTTPLDADEAADLIPTHLTTRGQLNAWEQVNIGMALDWLRRSRRSEFMLTSHFLRELHRRMFGDTWRWAGRFRHTEKNIGVPPHLIAEAIVTLLDDTAYWIAQETYGLDELGARFHHRLVSAHPFPNGNGRHARLATDLLLESLGAQRFSWGSANLDNQGDARSRYLNALRQADNGSVAELLDFVRS